MIPRVPATQVFISLSGERGDLGEIRLQRSCAIGTLDARGRRSADACFGKDRGYGIGSLLVL